MIPWLKESDHCKTQVANARNVQHHAGKNKLWILHTTCPPRAITPKLLDIQQVIRLRNKNLLWQPVRFERLRLNISLIRFCDGAGSKNELNSERDGGSCCFSSPQMLPKHCILMGKVFQQRDDQIMSLQNQSLLVAISVILPSMYKVTPYSSTL